MGTTTMCFNFLSTCISTSTSISIPISTSICPYTSTCPLRKLVFTVVKHRYTTAVFHLIPSSPFYPPSSPLPSPPPRPRRLPPHTTHPSSPSHIAFPSPFPSPFYRSVWCGVVWCGVLWNKHVKILLKHTCVLWRFCFVHPLHDDFVAEFAPLPCAGKQKYKTI